MQKWRVWILLKQLPELRKSLIVLAEFEKRRDAACGSNKLGVLRANIVRQLGPAQKRKPQWNFGFLRQGPVCTVNRRQDGFRFLETTSAHQQNAIDISCFV